jgi:hypothetical protein
MQVGGRRPDELNRRRSTTLRTAHVFCFGGKRADLGFSLPSYRRDALEIQAELTRDNPFYEPAGLRLASTLRPLTSFISHSFGMAARSRELPRRATDPPAECRAKRAGGLIAYLIRQSVQRHATAA